MSYFFSSICFDGTTGKISELELTSSPIWKESRKWVTLLFDKINSLELVGLIILCWSGLLSKFCGIFLWSRYIGFRVDISLGKCFCFEFSGHFKDVGNKKITVNFSEKDIMFRLALIKVRTLLLFLRYIENKRENVWKPKWLDYSLACVISV